MIRKRYLYFYVSIYLSINRICNYKVSVFIFCFLFTSIYNCFIYLSSPVSSRGKDQWQKFEFVGKRIKAFSVIDTLKPSTIQLAVYLSIFALSVYLSIYPLRTNLWIWMYINIYINGMKDTYISSFYITSLIVREIVGQNPWQTEI